MFVYIYAYIIKYIEISYAKLNLYYIHINNYNKYIRARIASILNNPFATLRSALY